jgi:hypothetical protein
MQFMMFFASCTPRPGVAGATPLQDKYLQGKQIILKALTGPNAAVREPTRTRLIISSPIKANANASFSEAKEARIELRISAEATCSCYGPDSHRTTVTARDPRQLTRTG